MGARPRATQTTASMPIAIRMGTGTSSARARMRAAWQCEERNPERLCEAGQGEHTGQRQHRCGNGKHQLQKHAGNVKTEKKTLEDQPLADEAVGGRQRGNRDGSDQKEDPGPRHAPEQATIFLHVPGMRGIEQRARAEEQQGLEHRVVDRMVEPGQQPERSKFFESVGLKDHAGADAQQDDADILHAMEREETLEVMFHQRIHHAQQR